MPTYHAKCDQCGEGMTYVQRIADHDKTPPCPLCQSATKQVILSAPASYVKGAFQPFKSHVDGSEVRSERELRAHNDRNNVVNLNDGYSDQDLKTLRNRDLSVKPDVRDIKADLGAAYQAVSEGYKPTIGESDE